MRMASFHGPRVVLPLCLLGSAPGAVAQAPFEPNLRDTRANFGRPDLFPIATHAAPMRALGGVDPTIGNPNPWAGLIGGEDFFEGFESYTPHTSLVMADWSPLTGQVSPIGEVWGAAPDYNGVVNNAIAQTGPNWNPGGAGFDRHGVLGGPDPTGARSQFFATPRGTIEPQVADIGGFFMARVDHPLFAPSTEEPLVILCDFYIDDISTMTWFRPVSFTEGFIVTNVFMGGIETGEFDPFVNEDNIADRIIVLGPKGGFIGDGEFFVAAEPHRIAEREWFTIAVRLTGTGASVWVRDSATVGVYGFDQDSVYDNFPGNPTSGAYAGEIFAADWLQVLPGLDDDPVSSSLEGNGQATNAFNQMLGYTFDRFGSPEGRHEFANTVDALQLVTSVDSLVTTIPDFQPHDWYADNYTVLGLFLARTVLPPPFCIPFLDDVEWLSLGSFHWQSDEWAVNLDAPSRPEVSNDQNSTPGGQQSIRHVSADDDGIMHEDFSRRLPRARATSESPVEASMFIRQSGPPVVRGVFADDNTHTNEYAFQLLLGARDGAGVVDDRVYARLPNPNFDAGQREAVGPSVADQHVNGTNTRFVNVPLVDSGGAPITTPLDVWYEVRAVMTPPYNMPGSLRLFIDGAETFANGAVEGITDLTAPSSVFDQLEFWSGYDPGGLSNILWVDDIMITGPELLRPTPQTVVEAPYTAHPLFALPYADDFSTYAIDRPLGGQGDTPFLSELIRDTVIRRLDVIALAPGDIVDTSTLGYYYLIDDVVEGALPPGVMIGDTVFIVNNIPPALPPDTAPIPGNPLGTTPTPVTLRDVACQPYARAEWILLDDDANSTTPIAPSAWDAQAPVLGRYWHTFLDRWTSVPGEEQLINDPANFPVNGNVVALTSSLVSGDANQGDLDEIFSGLLSAARPNPGERARLSFDLWVGIDNPLIGPRGRLAWRIFGPGPGGGEIATVIFGGPNNFLDENTFDAATGAITPGADGLPDDYYRGGPSSLGGPSTFADATRLYYTIPNPNPGLGAPDVVLEQASYVLPGNVWLRCTMDIQSDGAWTLTLDDGATTPFLLSGDALDGPNGANQGDVQGTDGFSLFAGFDAGASGEPFERPITWTGLGASAAPEGGAAPLPLGAGGNFAGSFNETVDPTYFYFEITEIWPGAAALPDVTDVGVSSGVVVGPRPLQPGDVVALWNDQSTSAFGGGAGAPFLNQIATHDTFFFSSSGGTAIDARGSWIPLGLPGANGVDEPAPSGGIVNTAPPYTSSSPYADILQGSIIDFPAFGPVTPPAAWFVDNVALEIVGCLGDLTLDSTVDGADLGVLLGAWGTTDPGVDLNGDGVIDGADLGLLLAAWGPCP